MGEPVEPNPILEADDEYVETCWRIEVRVYEPHGGFVHGGTYLAQSDEVVDHRIDMAARDMQHHVRERLEERETDAKAQADD